MKVGGALAGKTATQLAMYNGARCAIADGRVYCWGYVLGNGSNSSSAMAVAVDTSGVLAGKTPTKLIAMRNGGMCVIASGGLYCWGTNYKGQFGDGTTNDTSVPVATDTSGVLAGKTITDAMSAGDGLTCAIADGRAYCWGANSNGQLGNGSTTDSSVPVAVDTSGVLAGKTVTQLVGSPSRYMCAIATAGAYCWGANSNGQLGNGTMTDSSVPVATGRASGVTALTVSSYSPTSCAVQSTRVYCWGTNGSGETGTNSADGLITNPGLVVQALLVPEVGSISPDSVVTNVSGETITIYGQDFDGDARVEFDGQPVTIMSQSSTYIIVQAPSSATARTVDVKVTNSNGYSVTIPDGLRYRMPTPKVITGVTFGTEAGKTIMTIAGTGLVGTDDPAEFQQAFSPPYKSFVSLNGTLLNFCTDGTGFTEADLVGYGIPTSSDKPDCYYLFDSNVQPIITPTSVKVWLANSFDTTAPGTVSVNGLAPFAFNQSTGGGADDNATAVVDGRSLTGTPEIAKRPTFSGTAEPGARVTVMVHSDPVTCTATADAQGRWTCTLPRDLEPGQHTVYIHVVNPDNSTEDLGPYTVTVAGDNPIMLSAPNTGAERIRVLLAPHVLMVAGGAMLSLGVLVYAGCRRMASRR